MLEIGKRKSLSLKLAGILCASLLAGCGAPGENATPEPTKAEVVSSTPAPTKGTGISAAFMQTGGTEISAAPEPTKEAETFTVSGPGQEDGIPAVPETSPDGENPSDRYAGYRKYSPFDGLTVYFAVDGAKQVVLQYEEKETVFDYWDYDLSCGEPIFRQQGQDKSAFTFCYVILPTQECENVSPAAAGEVCGEWHLVRLGEELSELSWMDEMDGVRSDVWMKEYSWTDETREDFRMAWEETEDGRCPVLHSGTNPELNTPSYAYPALREMEQDSFELVQEEVLHITDRMMAYRRLGVCTGDSVVWLGKLWDDILLRGESGSDSLSSRDGGCFVPDAAVQYGDDWYARWLQSGEMRALDPDSLLDMDGDGTQENISWRVTEGNRKVVVSVTDQAGQQISAEVGDGIADCDFRPFAVSLDGRTVQLVLQSSQGVTDYLSFYRYEEGKLEPAGGEIVCREHKYTVTGRTEDGGLKFSTEGDSGYRLGAVMVSREYVYEDGQLKERKPEFYDILNADLFYVYPKRELVLYASPDGVGNVIFAEGSRLRRVRCSELTVAPPAGEEEKSSWGWVLLENADTGEQGWLQMDDATQCILRDGTVVSDEELFDGIQGAD